MEYIARKDPRSGDIENVIKKRLKKIKKLDEEAQKKYLEDMLKNINGMSAKPKELLPLVEGDKEGEVNTKMKLDDLQARLDGREQLRTLKSDFDSKQGDLKSAVENRKGLRSNIHSFENSITPELQEEYMKKYGGDSLKEDLRSGNDRADLFLQGKGITTELQSYKENKEALEIADASIEKLVAGLLSAGEKFERALQSVEKISNASPTFKIETDTMATAVKQGMEAAEQQKGKKEDKSSADMDKLVREVKKLQESVKQIPGAVKDGLKDALKDGKGGKGSGGAAGK